MPQLLALILTTPLLVFTFPYVSITKIIYSGLDHGATPEEMAAVIEFLQRVLA